MFPFNLLTVRRQPSPLCSLWKISLYDDTGKPSKATWARFESTALVYSPAIDQNPQPPPDTIACIPYASIRRLTVSSHLIIIRLRTDKKISFYVDSQRMAEYFKGKLANNRPYKLKTRWYHLVNCLGWKSRHKMETLIFSKANKRRKTAKGKLGREMLEVARKCQLIEQQHEDAVILEEKEEEFTKQYLDGKMDRAFSLLSLQPSLNDSDYDLLCDADQAAKPLPTSQSCVSSALSMVKSLLWRFVPFTSKSGTLSGVVAISQNPMDDPFGAKGERKGVKKLKKAQKKVPAFLKDPQPMVIEKTGSHMFIRSFSSPF